jgi:hypothetical protein
MMMLIARVARRATRLHREERGLNTAELLGNAALAIVALVAIWYALRQAGLDVIDTLTDRIMNEDLD